jgi:Leucine-rich repeat (LRR) protein
MTIKTKRRWFRFSLRTLLVLMTVLAVWLGMSVKKYRDHRAAITAIKQLNGSFSLNPIEPGWRQRFVSDERYFWDPVAVRFSPRFPISDHELRSIIQPMLMFENLTYLNLNGSHISDAGIKHILPLADRLQILDIRQTSVSDDCIVNLRKLRRLRLLRITGSAFSVDALNQLRTELPNCKFELE